MLTSKYFGLSDRRKAKIGYPSSGTDERSLKPGLLPHSVAQLNPDILLLDDYSHALGMAVHKK
jgi:hypothetical protein